MSDATTGAPPPVRINRFPVASMLVTVFLILAALVSGLVFTLDAGRHVPTGSVLGFEGPSYFYVSGLVATILAVISVLGTVISLRRVAIQVDRGQLAITERRLIGERTFTIPTTDIRVAVIDPTPRGPVFTWLVLGLVWIAFLFQLAIPNLAIPNVITGGTLLFTIGCIGGALIIRAWMPGIRVQLIDARGDRHVLRFASTIVDDGVARRLDALLAGSLPLQPARVARAVRSSMLVPILLVVTGVLACLNLVALAQNSILAASNQVSSWCIVLAWLSSLWTWRSSREPTRKQVLAAAGSSFQPSPRAVVMATIPGLACIIVLAFSLGKTLQGAFMSATLAGWSIAFHGIVLAVLISIITWTRAVASLVVETQVNENMVAKISFFGLRVVGTRARSSLVPMGRWLQPGRQLLVMLVVACISAVIAGLLR